MSLVEVLPAFPFLAKSSLRFAWNEKSEDRLRTLWKEGRSGAQIGAELGLTRNAIIGKANRLGLERRVTKSQRTQIKPRPKRTTLSFVPALVPPSVPASPNPPLNLSLLELTDKPNPQCRYIAGDDLLYCGHPANPDSSYCPFHHALTHMPMPKKERKPFWRTA